MPSDMALVLGDGAAGPPRYCGDALQWGRASCARWAADGVPV